MSVALCELSRLHLDCQHCSIHCDKLSGCNTKSFKQTHFEPHVKREMPDSALLMPSDIIDRGVDNFSAMLLFCLSELESSRKPEGISMRGKHQGWITFNYLKVRHIATQQPLSRVILYAQ